MVATSQPGGTPLTQMVGNDYDAGAWYTTDLGFNTLSSSAITVNVISFVPFIPTFTHTFTGMGWFHNSAAQTSHNIRLGIYSSTNRKPSTLVNDFGNVATTAAVAFRTATTGTATLFAGKLYWMAANCDSSLTGLAWDVNTAPVARNIYTECGLIDPGTVFTNATGLVSKILGYTQAQAFGAMPAIGTLLDNGGWGAGGTPVLFMKG